MKEKEFSTQTVGEIVARDYRTASVFREAGIDFCCGGKKTLSASCNEKGIDEKELISKIDDVLASQIDDRQNFIAWEPSFLCDYIINVHHTFVKKSIPDLTAYTEKIAVVHAQNHPELKDVALLFSRLKDELMQHLKNEEEELFPAIKGALTGSEKSAAVVHRSLSNYTVEHEAAGDLMDKINEITANYKLPEDACNTYRVTFSLLSKFEDDLHTHVHLENNVLFPKVIDTIQ